MTFQCRRCDFRADDDDAAAQHALESGHLRCIVCRRRSLTEQEPQTCATCIARVRADLADLLHDMAMLEPRSLTALTLIGDGTMQRHGRPDEIAHGIRDEWPNDPLPVLPALASWEDFWREDFGDPKGPPATLAGVIGYLMANLDTGHRAAQQHHAFDEFAHELARIRSTVRHTAGLADDPVEAPARCFDCGGHLLRTYGDEGLTDDWTCEACRGVYDQASYFLALRAHHAAEPQPEWRPLAIAAWLVDRSFRTVQTWVRELEVAVMCDVVTGRQFVWMPDVKARSDATSRRDRKSA